MRKLRAELTRAARPSRRGARSRALARTPSTVERWSCPVPALSTRPPGQGHDPGARHTIRGDCDVTLCSLAALERGETEARAERPARGHRAAARWTWACKAGLGASQRAPVTLPSAPAWLARPWGPAAFQGTGSGPGRALLERFPVRSPVARGRRRPAPRPHPPPAARHHARHMRPVPRHALLRLRPGATSALAPATLRACACAPWPVGRPLTWASTWPGRRQWQGGASRSPRPSAPRPVEGHADPRLALAPPRPAGAVGLAA